MSKRIAIVASYAPSLIHFRGALIEALIAAGHEVIGCAPEADPQVIAELRKRGASFAQIHLSRTGVNPLKDIFSIWSLSKELRRLNPDVVLGYTIKPVIYGSLAASLAGVPHVFSMITGLGYAFGSGTLKHKLVGAIVRLLYRISLGRNEAVFFQNPDDRKLFLDLGLVRSADRAVLINGSGVDLDYYAVAPPMLEPISFLLIARLIEEKGILLYAEAARRLKRKYPQLVFGLLGSLDSNPTSISQAQLDAWQAEGVLEYYGEVPDVRPFIERTSVYVLPSYYREGTPRSVLEAMSMGRPIITTDSPGCRETVIAGENGFLVRPRDVETLVAAMEKFVLNPDLIVRMGQRSREIATVKYDVHKVNAKIIETMNMQNASVEHPHPQFGTSYDPA